MAQLFIDIVSAEGHIHSGEAQMVFAPAEMGEVGIAPRHAPLLTRLKPGTLRVQTLDGEMLPFFVTGRILEVQPHLVTVLADAALRAKDADEAAAQAAIEECQKHLAGAGSEIDMAKAQADLVVAAARLDFVRKLRGPGHH